MQWPGARSNSRFVDATRDALVRLGQSAGAAKQLAIGNAWQSLNRQAQMLSYQSAFWGLGLNHRLPDSPPFIMRPPPRREPAPEEIAGPLTGCENACGGWLPRISLLINDGLRKIFRTFLEVSRLTSFSRAAQKAPRTQPAISAQIRTLEQEVGARLFDRDGGKVTFTAAGRLFEPFAEYCVDRQRHILLAIAEQEAIAARRAGHQRERRRPIFMLLPQVFAQFRRQYPRVMLSVVRAEAIADPRKRGEPRGGFRRCVHAVREPG